jgi:thiamine-phosphate pyrophosphorylase
MNRSRPIEGLLLGATRKQVSTMKIIVITLPYFVAGEAAVIEQLLEHGVWAVHLRKPQSAARDMARLIEEIPAACRPKIVLHDHFDLCATYGLKGVHLNRRNPIAPEGHRGSCSKSTHSIDELKAAKPLTNYAFLSPIFDSISKQGYHSAFLEQQLRQARDEGIIDARVMALGGVTTERLPQVANYGFGGAAMLGDVWQHAQSPTFGTYLERLEQWAVDSRDSL